MQDVTLQINLSPGDLTYAKLTVPALLRAHPRAAERLLIVDVCKPQRTGIVDPETRFPEPAFSERAAAIVAFAEELRRCGAVDRVVVLRPGDPLFATLSRRYLRPWVRETHDYGGCALMAYLAAFELPRTRWLLHYDADMLLYQEPGFDWAVAACTAMEGVASAIAASPRPSPPPVAGAPDAPTKNERLRLHEAPGGWLNAWFSTRCYLFDLEKMRACLPLLQGRIFWETVATRLLHRGYPRSPEGMLYRRMSALGRHRLTLSTRHAWLLHPTRKDAAFLAALPRLLDAVQAGRCPDAQRGQQDIILEAWTENILSR